MDIQDHERVMATIKLMGALETGRKSGEEQGWISSEQLKSELVKAKSTDVAKDLESTLKLKAEELKQKAREVKDITADAAKDITDSVKEKSVGAAKEIREKVAEKAENKEEVE